jgi:hypothetical protein
MRRQKGLPPYPTTAPRRGKLFDIGVPRFNLQESVLYPACDLTGHVAPDQVRNILDPRRTNSLQNATVVVVKSMSDLYRQDSDSAAESSVVVCPAATVLRAWVQWLLEVT